MADLTSAYPCILFALSRESQIFRRAWLRLRRLPFRAWLCRQDVRTALLVETGMGPSRTEAALEWVLSSPIIDAAPYRPSVVLCAGFSGSLQEGVGVGDIVLATEVADLGGHCWSTTWPTESMPHGEAISHRGRLLTTLRLIGTPDEKQLGARYGALAADMETATVARVCSAHRIPFGCVRAISDDVHTALSSRLASLLSRGRVSLWRVLAVVAASPRLAGELCRLAKHTRMASERLARALTSLLSLRQ